MVLLTNHIRAIIDNAVAMYCFLDDYLKLIKHKEDKQCKMNDAEIMMTALIASFYLVEIMNTHLPTCVSRGYANAY